MNNIKELRQKLTDEQIKQILGKYNVYPKHETETAIIYPTVCHNLTGGKPKLYYYKKDKIFKCYTECNDVFDIFTLLIKMHKLRGEDITISQAIEICGLDSDTGIVGQEDIKNDINYLYNLLHTTVSVVNMPHLNNEILNRFIFDKTALSIWEHEGISYETMHKYDIRYDPVDNCIIIPNHDIDGNLISIRGRYLDEDAVAKYRPIFYNGKVLSHPSAMNLYGLDKNKQAISRNKRAIIFESEKSVLMMDTIYGTESIAVATLGKNISAQQIKLLSSLGINEVYLAYDADYRSREELDKKKKEYIKIGNTLKPYFNVAILFDHFFILEYKDSPIDRGKEKFEKILQDRIYI